MTQTLINMLDEKKFNSLKKTLAEQNPVDIAGELEQTNGHRMMMLFRLLPKDLAAEVFSYMEGETKESLIGELSDTELKEILGQSFLDDTVDMIEELPANVVERILNNTDARIRSRINEILNYPKDSAGSIMTTEYLRLSKDMTVFDAISVIRKGSRSAETIYVCYVVEKHRLVGTVSLRELLEAADEQLILEIMEQNTISVCTTDDKEDVARSLSKYDLLSMPVVYKEGMIV